MQLNLEPKPVKNVQRVIATLKCNDWIGSKVTLNGYL